MNIGEARALIREATFEQRLEPIARRRVVEIVEQPIVAVIRPNVDQRDCAHGRRNLAVALVTRTGTVVDEDRARLPIMTFRLPDIVRAA